VVLIHHPPILGAHYFRRLVDAPAVRAVLEQHGAELVLHGHHHATELNWIGGRHGRIPIVGVPSASGVPGHHDEPAGYNLYLIDGEPGAWRCTMIAYGLRDAGFAELSRQPFAA
jgi:3',5'-cyclic AMP phosphodiesterase CpdA